MDSIIFKKNTLDVRCSKAMNSLTCVAVQVIQPGRVSTILCKSLLGFRIVFWWYETGNDAGK